MLHLRSSDRYVPEVSIPLIVNQTTACWASDGMTCGSGYFKTGNERTISPKAFYQTYITPFIRVIQQYGTAVSTS